jgi:polyisoprenoid-binding protein YceI
MKSFTTVFVTVLLALLLMSGVAQAPYKIKTSKMTVAGTSSLHEWESEVTQVEWTGSFDVENNMLKAIKDVTVKIPVTSIKSTKGKIMDNKTYDAFEYEKNPHILFRLTDAKITGTAANLVINANGTLTMKGVTKNITLTVTGKLLANGDLQLTGTRKLNMKDFMMEPPTAMMGAIKVGEEVTVKFDLTVTPTK